MPVYMDNQSTTRVDPRVIETMVAVLGEDYGNAGSTSHTFGHTAREAVEAARSSIAHTIGATEREIIFTSGATESINLATRGLAEWPRRRGNHIVSVSTEHKATLDPLARLGRRDFEVTLLQPEPFDGKTPGRIDPQQVADAITPETFLVSVMIANNEIGIIQPIREIGEICQERGVLFHSDAAQALGKLPINVETLHVDLMSFSGHKVYGPKGVGALYLRRRPAAPSPSVRLAAQIDGGGQEHGLRSGTLNVPGIVGFARAVELCYEELASETKRLKKLRNDLAASLIERIPYVRLNGPALDDSQQRLVGNLNVSFADVDGEALMMNMPDLAVSSGSACTSANPETSHVLRALGLSDDLARSSLRFGLGRFNTEEDVEFAVKTVADAVERLRQMS